MRKSTRIWMIAATSLLLVGGLLFGGAMSMLNWNFEKLSAAQYETNTYEITEEYKSISVITDCADVVFEASQDTTVVCHEQSNMKHLVSVKDGVLLIEIHDTRKWHEHIGVNFDTSKITVSLPQGAYDALSIKGDTGDVKLPHDFTFESLDVSTSTGNINSQASVRGAVTIKASTGDICLDGISAGSLDLSVTTGKLEASFVSCEGDVTVGISTGKTVLKDLSCKNLTSSGVSGDVLLENVISTGKMSVERTTGSVKLVECDAAEVFVKTDTGRIDGSFLSEKIVFAQSNTGKINVPKSTVGGKCEIITNTGDIKIQIP